MLYPEFFTYPYSRSILTYHNTGFINAKHQLDKKLLTESSYNLSTLQLLGM